MNSSDPSGFQGTASAMPHSTLHLTPSRLLDEAHLTRSGRDTSSTSTSASAVSVFPDDQKRLTLLFQEIEAIIGEMDPRSTDDIHKQIEKHGIVPRIRHSIDMSVAEWQSVERSDRTYSPPQGFSGAMFTTHSKSPVKAVRREEPSPSSKRKKTKPLDVHIKALWADGGKEEKEIAGKAGLNPTPIVPEKRFATPISDRYRTKATVDTPGHNTPSPSLTDSSSLIGIYGAAPTASVSSGSHYSSSRGALSLNSQTSRLKPLPLLPPEAAEEVPTKRSVQPFRYSELLARVVSLAPYVSDRSRRALAIIAREIDWWDDQFEQEFGHRCEAVHLPGYPLSSEDVRAYYRDMHHNARGEARENDRKGDSEIQHIFRPEETTTLKKANEARELQRAASVSNARGSALRRAQGGGDAKSSQRINGRF